MHAHRSQPDGKASWGVNWVSSRNGWAAAKEKGLLAIGNVIDTQADYPDTVVASAIWHFEPTLDAAIEKVKAGTFKAEDYGVYSFMKEGGASLAPRSSSWSSRLVMTRSDSA